MNGKPLNSSRTLKFQRGDWVQIDLPQARRIGRIVSATRDEVTVAVRFDGGTKRLVVDEFGMGKLKRGRWHGRRFVT